jgi:Bacterial RNA polymerase, alpha chain C terminal domain
MSEKVREPLFFEDADDEPEPEPSTESAGSGGRLTAVGSDLGNGEGDEEPPMVVLRRWSEDDEEPVRIATGIGAGVTVSRRWFFAPIEDLTLSMRAYNCMRRSGLLTLAMY